MEGGRELGASRGGKTLERYFSVNRMKQLNVCDGYLGYGGSVFFFNYCRNN